MTPLAPPDSTSILGLFLCCALCLTPLWIPADAHAQDDSERQAEELFAQGRQHFEDQNYDQAAEDFVDAYEILEAPELLYNIGQAQRRAGNLVDAEYYFQKYLNETQDPPNEDDVAEMIIDIQQQLAARKATVDVSTDPGGAAIIVDDEHQCESPCSFELTAGSYDLRAELDGYQPVTAELDLDVDDEIEQQLSLEQERVVGDLVVQTDVDDATLHIGDERHALPHDDPIELQTGAHDISIEYNGDAVDYDIEIERDTPTHLVVPVADATSSDFSPLRASAIGLGGISAALATAAVITGFQTRSTYRRLEAQQESAGVVDTDLVATGRSQQSMTNGLWLGATAALTAGAGLLAWEWYDNRDSSEELEPTEDPDDEGDPDINML